jgi:hypothetical protein
MTLKVNVERMMSLSRMKPNPGKKNYLKLPGMSMINKNISLNNLKK